MARKLNSGEKHLLHLVARDADAQGWAPVSAAVFPLLKKMPEALVALEQVGDQRCGRVRLTEEGRNVLNAMAWLE